MSVPTQNGESEHRATSSGFVDNLLARALPDGADVWLATYAARSEGKKVVYLSTPITTGPRYLDWHRAAKNQAVRPSSADEFAMRSSIMADNMQKVLPLKNSLHQFFPDALIVDPTEINQKEWTQSDYHRFWAEVIRRWADIIVFADGWEYSSGCSFEYAIAMNLDLPAYGSELEVLSESRATELLTAAVARLSEIDLDPSAAEAALDALDKG
jgi:hypothetical protein